MQYLTLAETAFVEAAVDTLIPADEAGPGALELGVTNFVDRQMAGAHGQGARLYLKGPFPEATPQQGYQLPYTPAALLRAGIADADAWCQAAYNNPFAALEPTQRIAALTEIEAGRAQFATVPASAFFTLLLQLTKEGFFADPIHGGNRGKQAWQMIGFPGVGGSYADKIAPYRNKPCSVLPQGIEDIAR
jgi:gluconate 2-dehydrogenase gamma chain